MTAEVNGLNEKLIHLLIEKGLKISTAESCTGGLLSALLTDVSGASEVLEECIVTYSNEVKERELGVKHETLEKHGAVSRETAEAMAIGARGIFGTDYAVSVTGLAGPEGDGSDTPVGTVFISLACEDGVFTRSLNIGTFRARLRTMAANHALDMLRRHMTGLKI